MTNKCECCSTEVDKLRVIKTTDLKVICKPCYDKTCLWLCKGLISLEECVDTKKLFQDKFDGVMSDLKRYKKYCIGKNISNRKLFKNVVLSFPEIALEKYNKLPTSINVYDEIEMISIIMKNPQKYLGITVEELDSNKDVTLHTDTEFYNFCNTRYNIVY